MKKYLDFVAFCGGGGGVIFAIFVDICGDL